MLSVLQIDAFVMVSCNKGAYINQKDVIVPIVTLLELELAFNENRSWDDPLATDFSFLLPGQLSLRFEHQVSTQSLQLSFPRFLIVIQMSFQIDNNYYLMTPSRCTI